MGFPTFLAFVVAVGAVVFSVSNPPAFSALARAGVVSRYCEAEGDYGDSGG